MKLVHKSLTAWFATLCVISAFFDCTAHGQSSEYQRYFNPAKGFKPAQPNLTAVFLQLAGSLEHHGSPEPYLRHMQKEHARVSAKYEKQTAKKHPGRRPSHMTDQYIDKLISNWKLLSPRLDLTAYAKDAGRCTREGIRGTRNTGTIVIDAFNEHQRMIADQMKRQGPQTIGFDQLRAKLTTELEYDKKTVNMTGYDASRRDAVSYALIFEGIQARLYERIDSIFTPANANLAKEMLTSMLMDLGYMAHSELEIAILDWSLGDN